MCLGQRATYHKDQSCSRRAYSLTAEMAASQLHVCKEKRRHVPRLRGRQALGLLVTFHKALALQGKGSSGEMQSRTLATRPGVRRQGKTGS